MLTPWLKREKDLFLPFVKTDVVHWAPPPWPLPCLTFMIPFPLSSFYLPPSLARASLHPQRLTFSFLQGYASFTVIWLTSLRLASFFPSIHMWE